MTVDNPLPDRSKITHSIKCACGCRFTFERGEARFETHPARMLFIMCPECGKECCKCLDDAPRQRESAEFRFRGY